MGYTVTSMEKPGKGRICICLDDKIRFLFYRGEISQYGLKEGSQVSEEEYQQMLHGILGKRAAKRAMHVLERQEKTEYQLREKLGQNEYPQEAIEDAIAYVKKFHYLDDERYARTFILFHQEKRSRRKLAMDLQGRGISKEIIDAAMEEVFSSDERSQIEGLLRKRQFPKSMGDDSEFRRNYQFLMRRGYKSSDILQIMKNMTST